MFKKIGNILKDIFFPHFSELELITLFFIITLLLFEQRGVLISLITKEYNSILQISNSYERFKLFANYLFLMVFILFFYLGLIYNAVKKRVMSALEQEVFSFLFYVVISLISFLSIFELREQNQLVLLRIIENLSLAFLILRSLGTLVLTLIFSKTRLKEIYSSQITNEQLTKIELVLLVIISTITYLFLRNSHGVFSTLSLSYFYVTSLVLLYRYFANKLIKTDMDSL